MTIRVLVGVALAAVLVSACTMPLSQSAAARVSFSLTVPTESRGIPFAQTPSRMIVSETATLSLTIRTSGLADDIHVITPVVDTTTGVATIKASLTTTPGLHTFIAQTLDAAGAVLTEGKITLTLVAGANVVPLSLLPPTVLGLGVSRTPDAATTSYYVIPGALAVMVDLSGTNSQFQEVDSLGADVGSAGAGTLIVDATTGSDKYVRVVQGAAGSFTANHAKVQPVQFDQVAQTYPTDIAVKLSDPTGGAAIEYSLDGTNFSPYTNTPIAVAGDLADVTITARASLAGYIDADPVTANYKIDYSTTAVVTFDQAVGTHNTDFVLALASTTASAVIEYSLDAGTTWTLYTTAIPVAGDGATLDIMARASKSGMKTSAPTSASYLIDYSKVTNVVFGLTGGLYTSNVSVGLSNATSGATIEYSINGGAFQTYGGAISLGAEGTYAITARANASGMKVSDDVTVSYTINYDEVADPGFSLASGTYTGNLLISLTDATSGAVIEYSIDGGAFQTYSTPIQLTGQGTYTIAARANASGMNISGTKTATYQILYPGITISFVVPTAPDILGQASTTLDASESDTLAVGLGADNFDSYTWFIDGHTTDYAYDGAAFAFSGQALLVESAHLATGTHEVSVIVSNTAKPALVYSARFLVEVTR